MIGGAPIKIGIVPTKWGYNAICLPPYLGDWELNTPVELQHDMLIQLRSQILHKLAIYCHDLSEWTDQFPLALLWAAWGIAALALCGLWTYGLKYVGLYMWVRFFFFGDGIWLLARTLAHWKGLLDARRIREKISLGQWVSTNVEMPQWSEKMTHFHGQERTEREFIEIVGALHPETIPYYDEMLRIEEPWAFSAAPLGVMGLIKYLLMGVKLPRPILCFELGDLK